MRIHVVALLVGLCLSGGRLFASNRFRIAEPLPLTGNSGWAVSPRTGQISVGIPVATVSQEIPIPVVYRMNGSHTAVAASWLLYKPGSTTPTIKAVDGTGTWTKLLDSYLDRPAYGTLNFGYISQANSEFISSTTYVLEDGTQFSEDDFSAFTAYNSTFTLAEDFGLLAVSPSSARVSNSGTHAYYNTTSAGLGSWAATVASHLPSNYGTLPTTYRVVLDKDRARVFVYVSSLSAYVPVLWLDKFSHSVTFQWTRSTSGLASGMTAKNTLDVRDTHSKGLTLQWGEFSSSTTQMDLFRLDFVGIAAPSIQGKGYPGLPTSRPMGLPSTTTTYTYGPGAAGPVGRPTQVQVGTPASIIKPSWASSVSSTVASGDPVVLSWSFSWDLSTLSSLNSLTDALGITTAFTHQVTKVDGVSGCFWAVEDTEEVELGDFYTDGITKAISTDSTTGETLSRSWTWTSLSSGYAYGDVVLRETYGDLASASRELQLNFDTGLTSYGNGVVKSSYLYQLSNGARTSDAAIFSTCKTLASWGLDSSRTATAEAATTRDGEVSATPSVTLADSVFATPSSVDTTFDGSTLAQSTNYTWESKKEKLETNRPKTISTVRYDNGAAVSPSSSVSTMLTYNSNGQLTMNARSGASGAIGQYFTYDTSGRVTDLILSSSATTAPSTSATPETWKKKFAYDDASGGTGLLSTLTTTYLSGATGTSTALLTQKWNTYNSAGQATKTTDERSVETTASCDILGRPVSITRGAEPAVKYTYTDLRTTKTTRSGLISAEDLDTVETRDGFGRPIKVVYPTGAYRTYAYSDNGLLEATKDYSSTGTARPAQTVVYDGLDRPVTLTSSTGSVQSITYSQSSGYNVITRTMVITGGTSTQTVVSTEYRDAFGQLVKSISPNGDMTEMSYDGLGNLINIKTTPSGSTTNSQTRTFLYDDLGRLTTKTEPETNKQAFSNFTLLGKPTTIVEASGSATDARTRTLTYDGLGRPLKATTSTSTTDKLEWTYSGADSYTASTGSQGLTVKTTFAYDTSASRRLLSETTTIDSLSLFTGYSYDGLGRLDILTYPTTTGSVARQIKYGYDRYSRVTSIKDVTTTSPATLVSSADVDFDEWGNRTKLLFASGAYDEWTTTNYGQYLNQWNIKYGTGTLLDTSSATKSSRPYGFDSADRLTKAGELTTLTHDKQSQLTAASGFGITSAYAYDAYGNTTSHSTAATTGTVPSNLANWTISSPTDNEVPTNATNNGETCWKHNDRGEATRMGTGVGTNKYLTPTWDGLGRMNSVTYNTASQTPTQSYTYGPSCLSGSAA